MINLNARYAVAKYVPDLQRCEPRNIGIALWRDGVVRSLFFGDAEVGPLPRSIGVKDTKNYRRWVTYWREEMLKDALELGRKPKVEKASEKYLEELSQTSNGNYVIVVGGMTECDAESMDDCLRFLFDEIVAIKRKNPPNPQPARNAEL